METQEKVKADEHSESASSELLDANIQSIANAVCPHLPKRSIVRLCFENGAGWVELEKSAEDIILPDAGDKSLSEQLNDAICVANGWSI